MRCTYCKNGDLTPSFLEGLFRAHTCSSCNGHWVLIEDYVNWSEYNNRGPSSEEPNALLESAAEDNKKALLCPVTGVLMQKFRVAHKNEHRLDYSPAVGGVWLDPGEWELLKSEGLDGCLNAILTEKWQRDIRAASAKDTLINLYKEKFGDDGYEKVKAFREWLDNQPNKADMRSYLLARDPYSATQ